MKKLSVITSLILAGTLALSVIACSETTGGGSATDIEILAWESEYGREWLDRTIEAYNASQDTYTATPKYELTLGNISRALQNKESYDLYFTGLNTSEFDDKFVDMSDVLDYTPEGESESIRQKYYPYLLEGLKEGDGSYKRLSYGNNATGLVYNTQMISEQDVPRTTNELADLSALMDKDTKTFTFFNDKGKNGYWNYVLYAWEAQYDTLDYRNRNLLALRHESGNSPSKEVLIREDGRKRAIEVLDTLLNSTTCSADTQNTEFKIVQSAFIEGSAAVMPNGAWFKLTAGENKDNFKMMKTPVISAIVETFEGADKNMPDSRLAALVTAVDEGKSYSEVADQCSETTYKRIKEARGYMYNNAAEQFALIPEFSNAIDGAKDFLKFFYSDEALQIWTECTGLPATCRFDYEGELNAWGENQFALAESKGIICNSRSKSKIFVDYSMDEYVGIGFAAEFAKQGSTKTADDVWNSIVNTVNINWDNWSSII